MDVLYFGDHQQKERIFRPPTDVLSTKNLTKRYRLDRDAILWLTALLDEDIRSATGRSRAIPSELEVLVFLDYLASSSLQRVISHQINCDQASVSRIVSRVSAALNRRIGQFISFPRSERERQAIVTGFYNYPTTGNPRMPGVIGAIDGTHIELEVVPAENEPDFVNRKGRHSINVQLVCDHNGRFLNCFANFPGSSHDASILRASKSK